MPGLRHSSLDSVPATQRDAAVDSVDHKLRKEWGFQPMLFVPLSGITKKLILQGNRYLNSEG